MKLIFSPLAAKQWTEWNKVDPATAKRIKRLLQDILEHPYSGIGKPEPFFLVCYYLVFCCSLLIRRKSSHVYYTNP